MHRDVEGQIRTGIILGGDLEELHAFAESPFSLLAILIQPVLVILVEAVATCIAFIPASGLGSVRRTKAR